MSPTVDALLRSWPFHPGLIAGLGLTMLVYLIGWNRLRRRDPGRWTWAKLGAFAGGLAALFAALGSPIEPFASWLLQVHMIQHLLLMMAAPPLFWLGAPFLPLLAGLPAPVRTYWAAPLIRSRVLQNVFRRLSQPAAALPLFVAVTWLWHAPVLYEQALRQSPLHYLQHACFLAAGLLFWYPVVRPYPARPRWSVWLLFPYLVVADLANTVLSALLTFSSQPLYPSYELAPRLGGLSALDDQSAAGVIMWVPGSLVFLLPLFALAVRTLFGNPRPIERVSRPSRTARRTRPKPAPWDLLRVPFLGGLLRWRHARLVFQVPLLVLAVVLILDGLRGPKVGALNLAGVVPWIHWRGLVLIGLVAAGNLSCMACPFVVPRTLARRWLPAGWRWPRRLRTKWAAVGLLGLYLWGYEAGALWDHPEWTAAIIVAYFAAAFLVDGLFQGASFCKYVCPIGQFNFVQAQVSPLEVTVRDPAVCASCPTHDCLRGRGDLPGCELELFLPRKRGNLDCTFCLDCVHACPVANVAIMPGLPARDLLPGDDPIRSGLGRLSRRSDIAALILVLLYGGLASAAGMVGPVLRVQETVQRRLGLESPLFVVAGYDLLALIVAPVLIHGSAAALARRLGPIAEPRLTVANRYAFAFVPLGCAIWLTHMGFHFFTSAATIVPVTQRWLEDAGIGILGTPDWSAACCRPAADWVLRFEIVALEIGMLVSLLVVYRISLRLAPAPASPLRAAAPWLVAIVLLFAAAVWVVFQPMEMRGTLPGAG